MGKRWTDGYSADVELYLMVDGERYEIAQVGNHRLVMRDERSLPAGTEAILVINVDGVERRREINLCDGVPGGQQLVPYI